MTEKRLGPTQGVRIIEVPVKRELIVAQRYSTSANGIVSLVNFASVMAERFFFFKLQNGLLVVHDVKLKHVEKAAGILG